MSSQEDASRARRRGRRHSSIDIRPRGSGSERLVPSETLFKSLQHASRCMANGPLKPTEFASLLELTLAQLGSWLQAPGIGALFHYTLCVVI